MWQVLKPERSKTDLFSMTCVGKTIVMLDDADFFSLLQNISDFVMNTLLGYSYYFSTSVHLFKPAISTNHTICARLMLWVECPPCPFWTTLIAYISLGWMALFQTPGPLAQYLHMSHHILFSILCENARDSILPIRSQRSVSNTNP